MPNSPHSNRCLFPHKATNTVTPEKLSTRSTKTAQQNAVHGAGGALENTCHRGCKTSITALQPTRKSELSTTCRVTVADDGMKIHRAVCEEKRTIASTPLAVAAHLKRKGGLRKGQGRAAVS